jgi:4-hydroxybenzoate polyprenyltransferase
MISFLKLIRLPNLILIAALQYFIRQFLLFPMLASYGFISSLSNESFYLLLIASALISAAGYIINDYFDLRIDYVNKPEKVIIGIAIKRRVAMALHVVFSLLGVVIFSYLAFQLKVGVLALVPMLIVGLLWFYSTDYKRQFLIGNIVAGLLAVFPILLVVLLETSIFKAYYTIENKLIAVLILKVIGYFSVVVFLMAMLISILKDINEVQGDARLKCKTMPIVLGVKWAKVIVVVLVATICYVLSSIQQLQYANHAYVPLLFILHVHLMDVCKQTLQLIV